MTVRTTCVACGKSWTDADGPVRHVHRLPFPMLAPIFGIALAGLALTVTFLFVALYALQAGACR